MRRFACLVLVPLALLLSSTAGASGPWLGVLNGGAGVADGDGAVNYVALLQHGSTTAAALRPSAPSGDGRWVYTLYSSGDNYPFVHALDTTTLTARCVGLPWDWSNAGSEIMNADVTIDSGKLTIASSHGSGHKFALDTRTFKVTAL